MGYLSAYFRRIYNLLILMLFISVVAGLSEMIDVPIETGFSILFRVIVVFIVCIVLLVLQFLPFGLLFPIFCGCLAWAFFPALDYWSTTKMIKSLFGIAIGDAEWYVRWYTKTFFVLILILIGHSICYSWKKRNKVQHGPVEW